MRGDGNQLLNLKVQRNIEEITQGKTILKKNYRTY